MRNSKDILQQLEDVPHMLLRAAEAWKLHSDHDKLLVKTAVQDLCHTVTDCVSELIRILLRTQEGSCESS